MSKVFKTVFRKVGGKVTAFSTKVSQFAVSGLRYENSKVQGARGARALWKKFRTDPMTRIVLWRPGGAFDPKMVAQDKVLYEKNRLADLAKNIKEKYPSHDIGQAAGKRAAKKAQSFVDGINEIFGFGLKDLEAKASSAKHLSRAQMYKEASKPFSKKKFVDALVTDEEISKKLKKNIVDSAIELYEPYGGSGPNFIKWAKKQRKSDALRIQKEIKAQLPKPDKIDRIVSARGKGIVFRRIGGRIVPIRVKK